MKRTAKTMLSALLVMLFVFQFAGVMPTVAKADNAVFDEDATVSYKLSVQVEKENENGEKILVMEEVTAENAEELLGKDFSIDLSGEKLADIMDGWLSVNNVPEGYYVSSLQLCAEDKEPVENISRASASATSADVTLHGDYLNDAEALPSQDAEEYFFDIQLSLIDPNGEGKEAVVTYPDGSVESAGAAKDIPADVLEEAAANYQEVLGYVLRYANGSCVFVEVGEEIAPYADCALSYYTLNKHFDITVKADDKTVEAGTALEDIEFTGTITVDPASDMKVEGVSYVVLDAEDNEVTELAEGSYRIVPVLDNASVPAANHSFKAEEGVLTVNASQTQEKIDITITAKAPVFDAEKNEYVADGYVEPVEGLEAGDSIDSVNFEVKDNVSTPSGAVIVDALGEDVTENYNITYVPGTAEVVPTPDPEPQRDTVTVTVKDRTVTYNGALQTANEYTVEGLAEGDKIDDSKAKYTGGSTDVTDNAKSGIEGLVILDKDGKDVTAEYEKIDVIEGKLTVNKLAITITASSDKKEYDGKELTCKKAKITSGELVKNHKVEKATFKGSQTEVGKSDNVIVDGSVKIIDADKKDVTKNYSITLEKGTLEVTGKAVTDISVTASATKVYDGKALELSAKDIKVSPALPEGYTVSASFSVNSRTNAGKDTVTLTGIVIKDASGNDVTAKYNIKQEKGTLEVTKRPLTITSSDVSKVYDGKALLAKESKVTTKGQLEGHSISLKPTGSQTKVGSSDASFEVVSIIIKDTKEDVTKNYEVTYNFGKLTVKSADGNNTDKDNSNDSPKTGDTANLGLWIVLMVVAAAAVAVVVVVVIRKNKKNGAQ